MKKGTKEQGYKVSTYPEMDEIQKNIFKKMSAEEKIHLSMRLYWSARQLRESALRKFHPDWSEEKIKSEVKKAFLYART